MAGELDDPDIAMVTAFSKSKMTQDHAISAWQTAFMDSGVTMHIKMDDSVLSMTRNPNSGSIGQASGEDVEAERNGTSELRFSGERNRSS